MIHLAFHHLGIACRDLAADLRVYQRLGYKPEGEVFVDERQQIRGLFVGGPGPRLELLEGLAGTNVLEPWLARGVKIYHQGYIVDSVARALADLEYSGARTVRSTEPAVAFDGRVIAFTMLPNNALIELIEAR